MAFGFVYIHPSVDGNGRIHPTTHWPRLTTIRPDPCFRSAPRSCVSSTAVAPFSRPIRAPLLPEIEWQQTKEGTVEVLNQTIDFYRFFDATAHAEFLYACVEQTIVEDLPRKVRFLEAFDQFSDAVQEIVDMPAAHIELLQKVLEQNPGRFSLRARIPEFGALTDEESSRIEQLYADAFERSNDGRARRPTSPGDRDH
ncbi:hypothetical protein [Sphingomonas zeicaulis]|uniref:hypothetical protein n=1 Tax=Sphingomonas zeicaulis TaxID=1632740 RepID=UPI003D1C3322